VSSTPSTLELTRETAFIPTQLDAAAFQRVADALTLLWPEPSGQLYDETTATED
jgi:hypothetical protein